jgi:neutral ceramidase
LEDIPVMKAYIHIAFLLSVSLPVLGSGVSGPFQAGAAKVEITPPQTALPPGSTVRDPLFVRAIVISNGNTCAALVGADQGGLPGDLVERATKKAADATGCSAQNFVVSATHTHSGGTGPMGFGGKPDANQVEAAIVSSVTRAKAQLQPATMGFGTTQVYLNVNRDLFDGQKWYQAPNPNGPSDKTLSVLEFLGADKRPIAVYMNYAMHPIDFYLTGVISADFAGEASRYIEKRYVKSVAIFAQGASGDQNPAILRPLFKALGYRTRTDYMTDDRVDATPVAKALSQELNANARLIQALKDPVPDKDLPAYREALAEDGEFVASMGATVGESAIEVMKNKTPYTDSTGVIWSGQTTFSCPGRDRLDNSAREGVLPPYKDGADVAITVGVLRLGDLYIASVNGEVYSDIAARLKREAPESKLMVSTLANGMANSGYIYSNEASSHLTFQVIGSRLKPGCAEDRIVQTGLDLITKATQ